MCVKRNRTSTCASSYALPYTLASVDRADYTDVTDIHRSIQVFCNYSRRLMKKENRQDAKAPRRILGDESGSFWTIIMATWRFKFSSEAGFLAAC